jgi:hypothetical protein
LLRNALAENVANIRDKRTDVAEKSLYVMHRGSAGRLEMENVCIEDTFSLH